MKRCDESDGQPCEAAEKTRNARKLFGWRHRYGSALRSRATSAAPPHRRDLTGQPAALFGETEHTHATQDPCLTAGVLKLGLFVWFSTFFWIGGNLVGGARRVCARTVHWKQEDAKCSRREAVAGTSRSTQNQNRDDGGTVSRAAFSDESCLLRSPGGETLTPRRGGSGGGPASAVPAFRRRAAAAAAIS